MNDELPDWWTKAKKMWVEDDALTPDREGICEAWKRLFGRERDNESLKEVYDAGDAIVLYLSGRVNACYSYPGNNEIRLYVPAAPKVFCNCIGCGQRHEISNGQTVPPGWRAFTVAHWPNGNPEAQALGPLYLRICDACEEKMDRGPSLVEPSDATVLEGDGPVSSEKLRGEMFAAGWMVGVHNDYRLGGVFHTFWLFTHPSGHYVKGEGKTYRKALAEAVAAKRQLEDAGLIK